MRERLGHRGSAWLAWVAIVAGAALAACGGSGNAGTGDGQDAGGGDVTTADGTLGDDAALLGEVLLGDALGDVGPIDALAIDPPTSTLVVTDPAKPLTQLFKATGTIGGGAPAAVPAVFSVSDPTPGTVDPSTGLYTTSNKAAGTVTVTAAYGGKTATATLTVKLSYAVQGSGTTSPSPSLFDPGSTTVGTDPTKTPSFIYPSDQTMFPRNVYKILFQWRTAGMSAFQVRFTGPTLDVSLYTDGKQADCVAAGTGAGCWEADPTTWGWLADSAAGSSLSVIVSGADPAKPGTVYRSKPLTISFSKAAVPGAIYYWSTTAQGVRKATVSDAKPMDFFTPAQTGKCVACHTLSRNGKRLGADVGGETLWVAEVSSAFPPPVLI